MPLPGCCDGSGPEHRSRQSLPFGTRPERRLSFRRACRRRGHSGCYTCTVLRWKQSARDFGAVLLLPSACSAPASQQLSGLACAHQAKDTAACAARLSLLLGGVACACPACNSAVLVNRCVTELCRREDLTRPVTGCTEHKVSLTLTLGKRGARREQEAACAVSCIDSCRRACSVQTWVAHL